MVSSGPATEPQPEGRHGAVATLLRTSRLRRSDPGAGRAAGSSCRRARREAGVRGCLGRSNESFSSPCRIRLLLLSLGGRRRRRRRSGRAAASGRLAVDGEHRLPNASGLYRLLPSHHRGRCGRRRRKQGPRMWKYFLRLVPRPVLHEALRLFRRRPWSRRRPRIQPCGRLELCSQGDWCCCTTTSG